MTAYKVFDGTSWRTLAEVKHDQYNGDYVDVGSRIVFKNMGSDVYIRGGYSAINDSMGIAIGVYDGIEVQINSYAMCMDNIKIIHAMYNSRGGFYLKAQYGDSDQELYLHKVTLTISSSSKIEFTYINTESANLDRVFLKECLSNGHYIHCRYYNGSKWLPACFDKLSGSTLYFTYGTTSVSITPSSTNTTQTSTKLCYNTGLCYTD